MSTQQNEGRYVIVKGQKVYMEADLLREWNRFINETRNMARSEKRCGQPDYHRCCGDCQMCPWQKEGILISYDTLRDGAGFTENTRHAGYSPVEEQPSTEDVVIGNDSLVSVREKLYAYADGAYPNGAMILRMYIEDNMRIIEIARAVRKPQTTIDYQIKRIISYIRSHHTLFFDE